MPEHPPKQLDRFALVYIHDLQADDLKRVPNEKLGDPRDVQA
jgi:hypothetical protein